MKTKVCSSCKQEKSLTEFTSNKSRSDGKHHCCYVCSRARAKQWQQNNPDKVKNSNLKLNYGITLAEYQDILEAQNGRCAICSTDVPGGKGVFHVDHCHKSGKVRGLLCHHCNVGLGHFKDKQSLLLKAALYLNSDDDTPPSY